MPLPEVVKRCPRCGGEIREKYKKFECQKCDYKLWKVVASRQWETEEMDELLTNGVIGPVQGFRSKMGRAFAAMAEDGQWDAIYRKWFLSKTPTGEEIDLPMSVQLGEAMRAMGAPGL